MRVTYIKYVEQKHAYQIRIRDLYLFIKGELDYQRHLEICIGPSNENHSIKGELEVCIGLSQNQTINREIEICIDLSAENQTIKDELEMCFAFNLRNVLEAFTTNYRLVDYDRTCS